MLRSLRIQSHCVDQGDSAGPLAHSAHTVRGPPTKVQLARYRSLLARWSQLQAPRAFGMPIAELLSDPKRNRKHVKMRLLKAGLLSNSCQSCGLSQWQRKPLNMHLTTSMA